MEVVIYEVFISDNGVHPGIWPFIAIDLRIRFVERSSISIAA